MSFAATDRKRYCSESGRFPWSSSPLKQMHLGTLGSLLSLNSSLLTHGSQDDNVWLELSAYVCGVHPGSDLLVSFSSVLKRRMIFSPTSPSGTLTSSLVSPSSVMRER